MKKYTREIVLTALAFVALSLLYKWEGMVPFLGGLLDHITVVVLSIVFGIGLVLFSIHNEISILSTQHRYTDSKIRKPLLLFMRHRLKAMQNVRTRLTSSGGLDLDNEELEKFVSACFEANRGKPYIGTDRHVPSRFYELYSNYLGEQFTDGPGGDVRILFASETDLRSDYSDKTVKFKDFIENHVNNDVRLLQVEMAVAENLAGDQHFPSTDIGVFGGEFVAFFSPESEVGGEVKYTIQLEALTAERRSQLRQYLHMLNLNAREVRLEGDRAFCMERNPDQIKDDENRLLSGLSDSIRNPLRLLDRG
jgi:hypothetical protein